MSPFVVINRHGCDAIPEAKKRQNVSIEHQHYCREWVSLDESHLCSSRGGALSAQLEHRRTILLLGGARLRMTTGEACRIERKRKAFFSLSRAQTTPSILCPSRLF